MDNNIPQSIDSYAIALLNGAGAEGFTTPEGIVCGSLKNAEKYRAVIEEHYPDAELCVDGVFVYVPDGVMGHKPVSVSVVAKAAVEPIAVVVVLGRAASVEIVCETTVNNAVAGINKYAVLGKDSNLKVRELLITDEGGSIMQNSFVHHAEGSVAEAVTLELGDGKARLDYKTDLAGVNAESSHYGLYIVSGQENTDINVRVNHLVPDCRSNELIKGIASGNARGAFEGMVYVAQDAQRTEAYQQSRNLLLSDTAQITAVPQLEIYADDVKCSHGATVGQQDDNAVYYMRQRGLSEHDARRLQMTGFVNDIISHCGEGVFADRVRAVAEKKIDNL